MNLDDEELEATKKANGLDTKIVLNYAGLEDKLKELRSWRAVKNKVSDVEQYWYLQGKIDTLKAIKEGDLSKI